MQTIDVRDMPSMQVTVDPGQPESRMRQSSRERVPGATGGTYADAVAPGASADPRVRQFSLFILSAMDEARDRGMSIEDIEDRIREVAPDVTMGRSTIYRWRRAEVASPQRAQVFALCDALGIPRTTAAQILGWDGKPVSPEPDPAIDPDLRAVMRRLADPAVSTEEKTAIRATLRYLAKGG
jgi:transcriptional regulator with XRE-family HTH domain